MRFSYLKLHILNPRNKKQIYTNDLLQVTAYYS